MALNNSDDIRCIQFDIPFHKGCPDFIQYRKNINQIQQETQTDVKLLQIVRIKGDKEKVEEARRRVSRLNTNSAQVVKRENQEIHQLLRDIVNKISASELEKAQMAENIQYLKNKVSKINEFQMDCNETKNDLKRIKNLFEKEIQGIKNSVEENKNKVGVEMEKMTEIIQKDLNKVKTLIQELPSSIVKLDLANEAHESEISIEMLEMPIIVDKIQHDLNEPQINDERNEDLSLDQDVDLNDFCQSEEYKTLNRLGRQPFHIASILGRLDVVRKLFKKGAPLNIKDNRGYSPLHYSSQNGHLNLVKYLIRKNVDIDERNNLGNTALSLAAYCGHADVVEYLCSKKADLKIKNKDDKTPLDYARIHKRTEIIEILKSFQ